MTQTDRYQHTLPFQKNNKTNFFSRSSSSWLTWQMVLRVHPPFKWESITEAIIDVADVSSGNTNTRSYINICVTDQPSLLFCHIRSTIASKHVSLAYWLYSFTNKSIIYCNNQYNVFCPMSHFEFSNVVVIFNLKIVCFVKCSIVFNFWL